MPAWGRGAVAREAVKIPDDHPLEPERLALLQRCQVLDTAAEPEFDGLVELAAAVVQVPIALISLVDGGRQWFKSRRGIDVAETPRSISFCGHAILTEGEPLIVEDAACDPRFADNPIVTGNPPVRFYAGVPLRVGPRRLPVGTLCVVDHAPRQLAPERLRQLMLLARQAELLFELRLRQRELEDRLVETRRSEEKVRAIISAMNDGLVVQDAERRVVACNPAAERILGITADEMLGNPLLDRVGRVTRSDGSELPATERPSATALRTGCPVRGVVLGFGARDRRWILVNAQPLMTNGNGAPAGVVCSFSDITALRRDEAELRRAKEAAEAAGRAKSEFLATMSHEIRTPMNGVIGLTEVLRETPLTSEQLEMVRSIQNSGRALLDILDAILDWSRIEAGRLALERVPVDVRQIARDVRTVLLPLAAAKGLTLDVQVDDGAPPAAWGDAGRVRQVLFNLIGNAVKFTSEGGVTVRVWPSSASALAGGGCRVTITDTGIGIAPEHIGRLFRRFSQVDASTTRRFGGSGLGLAISRELIVAMGGRIDVQTEQGKGSTFIVDLPRADASTLATTPAVPPRAATQPLRVLLAEDNLVNQHVASAMLTRDGHEVEIAADGQAAVAACARREWDLVLMDVQMPLMDGLDATRAIRERERAVGAARVPVIALTASAMPEERSACLAAGMDDVLPKPVTSDRLRGLLATLTKRAA